MSQDKFYDIKIFIPILQTFYIKIKKKNSKIVSKIKIPKRSLIGRKLGK